MFGQRINGFGTLNRLHDQMNRLFDDFAQERSPMTGCGPRGTHTFPAMNVWEDENNLFVEAELPGMNMGDVDITVAGDELTIRGQRSEPKFEKAAFHRRERGAGSFGRVVRLPVEVNANKVEAKLHNGVLLITLPKAEEVKPRKVAVKVVNE